MAPLRAGARRHVRCAERGARSHLWRRGDMRGVDAASRHSEPGLDVRKSAHPSESILRSANVQYPGRPRTTVQTYPSPRQAVTHGAVDRWGCSKAPDSGGHSRHRATPLPAQPFLFLGPRQAVAHGAVDGCGYRKESDAAAIAPILYSPPTLLRRRQEDRPSPPPHWAACGSGTDGNSLIASRPGAERRRGRLSVPRAEGAA